MKTTKYLWDERYAEAGASFGEEPNEFLVSQQELIRAGGRKALCLGEGEGRNAIWLAQLGFQVTAVDLSSVGLRHTAERATKLGVEVTTIQADLGVWEIERHAWDLIVSIFCHLPPDVRSFVHQKVVQGLNANGLFVLEAYAPSQITRGTGGPSDVKLLASARQLAGELQGLEFVLLNETSRPVVEGHRHTGLADVVQVVAQKRA